MSIIADPQKLEAFAAQAPCCRGRRPTGRKLLDLSGGASAWECALNPPSKSEHGCAAVYLIVPTKHGPMKVRTALGKQICIRVEGFETIRTPAEALLAGIREQLAREDLERLKAEVERKADEEILQLRRYLLCSSADCPNFLEKPLEPFMKNCQTCNGPVITERKASEIRAIQLRRNAAVAKLDAVTVPQKRK